MADRLAPALTPKDVGKLLAVGPETVNRWADEGKLVGFKTPGGRWRFNRDAIADYMADAP